MPRTSQRKTPRKLRGGRVHLQDRLELEAVLDAERLTVGHATNGGAAGEGQIRQREDAVIEVQTVIAELEVQTAEVGADAEGISGVRAGPRVVADWAAQGWAAALAVAVGIGTAGEGNLEGAWRAEDAWVEREAGAEPTGARGEATRASVAALVERTGKADRAAEQETTADRQRAT